MLLIGTRSREPRESRTGYPGGEECSTLQSFSSERPTPNPPVAEGPAHLEVRSRLPGTAATLALIQSVAAAGVITREPQRLRATMFVMPAGLIISRSQGKR